MRLLLLLASADAGTAAATLGRISAAATAGTSLPGAIGATLGRVAASASAGSSDRAAAAATLGRISAAATAGVLLAAAVAATLRAVAASAAQTTMYVPPSPTGWKSTATRIGPDPDFSTATRLVGLE